MLERLQHEFYISVRMELHFFGIELRHGALGAHLQRLAQLVFRERVRGDRSLDDEYGDGRISRDMKRIYDSPPPGRSANALELKRLSGV